MIGYVTLGSNDLDKAKIFYDGVLADLGARRGYSGERMQFWITRTGAPMLSLCRPFDGEPASVGNGAMVAFPAETPEIVDAVHAKAITLGATDEGAPGQRLDWFYGGYFRDPDGNKICVYKLTGPAA
jgi:catechol 2,3-dioxygenase-like lactoylglutathione lyase family enzyme